MKSIQLGCAAIALAIFTLSIPAPFMMTQAFASKMNGKGTGCSEGSTCNAAHYRAAMSKTKTQPNKQ
jgi:hypothetical protein